MIYVVILILYMLCVMLIIHKTGKAIYVVIHDVFSFVTPFFIIKKRGRRKWKLGEEIKNCVDDIENGN